MTSINAIRFDDYSGAMLCDEQRHWNPERIKVYAADKIKPVVPDEIRDRYRFVAAYGNTGTSSIGDELRLSIKRRLQAEYERVQQAQGTMPAEFFSMEALARLVFNLMTEVKHRHINEELRHSFGFNTADFCAGKVVHDDLETPIRDPEVIKTAHERIAPDPQKQTAHPVFGNLGILAGYHPVSGYRIYMFSLREHFWEPVEAGFVCQGSGGDSTNFVMPRLFNALPATARDGRLDRLEALVYFFDAINTAAQFNLGVGGYFNLHLFDGRAAAVAELHRQINDHRVKLCSEAALAASHQLIDHSAAKEILDVLLFLDGDLDRAESLLIANCRDREKLHHLLRGYPA